MRAVIQKTFGGPELLELVNDAASRYPDRRRCWSESGRPA
jgi:hypothetical protein